MTEPSKLAEGYRQAKDYLEQRKESGYSTTAPRAPLRVCPPELRLPCEQLESEQTKTQIEPAVSGEESERA